MNLAELAIRNKTTTLVLTTVLFRRRHRVVQSPPRAGRSRIHDQGSAGHHALSGRHGGGSRERKSPTRSKRRSSNSDSSKRSSPNRTGACPPSPCGSRTSTTRTPCPRCGTNCDGRWATFRTNCRPVSGPSIVNDDYGDVWGIFIAIYGDEYTYAELKEVAKLLRRELLLVQDVAKVEFWGDRNEAVYVVPNRDRMSQLGIHPAQIIDKLRDKNLVADAGRARGRAGVHRDRADRDVSRRSRTSKTC